MNEQLLGEKEFLIRRLWLAFLFADLVFELVMTTLYATGACIFSWPSSLPQTSIVKIILYSSSLAFVLLQKTFFYFFSYKNHGTKLLTISLWLFWIGLIIEVSGIKKTSISEILHPSINIKFIISWSLAICWFILCSKLRMINRSIKKRMEENKLSELEV